MRGGTPAMVQLMKRTVPEFKSKNSEFEKYDAEITDASDEPTVSPSTPSSPSDAVSSSSPTAAKSGADTQSTPASSSDASPQKPAAQAS